jgi:hypothetical protein
MALRYSDKPQLNYGTNSPYGGSRYDDWQNRFPRGAQPIASAPQATSTPVVVYEPSGEGHRAVYYRGQWMKLAATRDPYTGEVHERMDGVTIRNPVMWTVS